LITAHEVDQKIIAHVDKCEVRYQSIQLEVKAVNARLKRIEGIGIAVAGGAFTTGLAIILLLIQIITKV